MYCFGYQKPDSRTLWRRPVGQNTIFITHRGGIIVVILIVELVDFQAMVENRKGAPTPHP